MHALVRFERRIENWQLPVGIDAAEAFLVGKAPALSIMSTGCPAP